MSSCARISDQHFSRDWRRVPIDHWNSYGINSLYMCHCWSICFCIHMMLWSYKGYSKKRISNSLKFSFWYYDETLTLRNPYFKDYLYLINPNKLEIRETTNTPYFVSYLDFRQMCLKSKLLWHFVTIWLSNCKLPFLNGCITKSPFFIEYTSHTWSVDNVDVICKLTYLLVREYSNRFLKQRIV